MGTDKEKSMKTLDALTEFLGSSEEQSTEEIKAELRREGMDVDAALARLKDAQQRIAMAARRSALDTAREKRLELENKGNDFIGKFRDWSREKIIDRIKEFSEEGGLQVDFAYRELESIGDEEIESLLEDLEMAHQRQNLKEGDNGA